MNYNLAFQKLPAIKKAILESPASQKMKDRCLKKLSEKYGNLDEDKEVDCFEVGLIFGRISLSLTSFDVEDFISLKNYISDLNNLPFSRVVQDLKTTTLPDETIVYSLDGEVNVIPPVNPLIRESAARKAQNN